jgi:DNA-binding LacI/PurR family transcriptional regulator
VRALLGAGVPVVQIDYHCPGLPVDSVVQDDFGGIILAVEHLHARGHSRIGYLDTSAELRAAGRALNSERRLAGFRAATTHLGLDDSLIAPVVLASRRAADGTAALLDAGVTALVVPHKELWDSVREVLARRAVALPGDFGVVAWGDPDASQEAAGFPSALTWSKEQMGREAARRLLLRLERPDVEPAAVIIPTRLVDRGTGGRGPGA